MKNYAIGTNAHYPLPKIGISDLLQKIGYLYDEDSKGIIKNGLIIGVLEFSDGKVKLHRNDSVDEYASSDALIEYLKSH